MKAGEIINQIAAAATGSDNGALVVSFVRNLIPAKMMDKEISLKIRADRKAVAVFVESDKVMEAVLEELPTYGDAVDHPPA